MISWSHAQDVPVVDRMYFVLLVPSLCCPQMIPTSSSIKTVDFKPNLETFL